MRRDTRNAVKSKMRRVVSIAVLSAAGAMAMGLSGCSGPRASVAGQGATGLPVTFVNGGITLDLPPDIRAPSAIAAVDQAVSSAGYVITGRDATLHEGRLVARFPDRRLGRRVDVRVSEQLDTTRMTVRVKPNGSEATARDIVERTLTRLGL